MKKIKITFLLVSIFFTLLVVSSKANAQSTGGACIYLDRDDFFYKCINTSRSVCLAPYNGNFYQGQICCQNENGGWPPKTFFPDVQQGCCSNNNTCTSGVIDISYYVNCLGYQCNEGNYECNNGTCESSTLITLKDFKAYAKPNRVIIEWVTESEIDNAGFNIYRAEKEEGEYIKINDVLIAANGSSTQGAPYEYVDNNVQNRKTYYYKLEDIDNNGIGTYHGPVAATPRLIYGLGK